MNAWVPPRPVRRVIVDPLWIPAAAGLAVLFAIGCLVGMLVAPLTPRRRVPRICALALVYLYADMALLLGACWLWLRHPRRRRDDARWRAAHARLLEWALGVFAGGAERLVGFQVRVEPGMPHPSPAAPLIVLARHGGPGDSFALVQLLLSDLRRRPRVVLKRALQWDPGLDVVLTRLSGCFLASTSGAGEDQRNRLAEFAASLVPGDALLLFPEGGNWTPRRHRRAIRHLLRSGRRRSARAARERTNVLPPRPGGTLACLLGNPAADVLVVAHTGLDTLVAPGQIWRAVSLHNRPMRVSWWLCPAATVPREEAAAEAWLERQWDKVDARIEALRRVSTGGDQPSAPARDH